MDDRNACFAGKAVGRYRSSARYPVIGMAATGRSRVPAMPATKISQLLKSGDCTPLKIDRYTRIPFCEAAFVGVIATS